MTLQMARPSNEDTIRKTRNKGVSRSLFVIVFTIIMLMAFAVNQPFFHGEDLYLPSLILCVFSFLAFLMCGGKLVNASSVASYGNLIFIGFPAVFGSLGLYESNKSYTVNSLAIVLFLAFLFQCGILLFADYSNKQGNASRGVHTKIFSKDLISYLQRISWGMLLLFIASQAIGAGIAANGFAWVSMLGGTVVSCWAKDLTTRVSGIILVLIAFVAETGLNLGSFGRLNLAVLAFSILVLFSLRMNSWLLKVGTAVFSGPILGYLINQRVEYLQTQRGSGLVDESEGIGSVVGPFHSAGAIIDAVQQERISLSWGESIFNAAVTGVPRSFWPEKPVGFGREIVEVTQPWLVSVEGYSDAATFIGEAVWNFGVWLAPLYLIGFLWLIRVLDKKVCQLNAGEVDKAALVNLMLTAMLVGTSLNIIWGSFSTAAARTMFPFAVLLMLWVGARRTNKQ